jgi:hypothetical protein
VSAVVKKNDKWAVIRDGGIVTDWFSDVRGWVINPEGNQLAAAVAEKGTNQLPVWKVIVLPLGTR